MKAILVTSFLLGSSFAYANDSGLNCTMSYSSNNALNTESDSKTGWWMSPGGTLVGSAVGEAPQGGWTKKPAHSILVGKSAGVWKINILNDKKAVIGSFGFPAEAGMKVTIPTKAYRANESEDPTEYNKLEVSCYFTYFAG